MRPSKKGKHFISFLSFIYSKNKYIYVFRHIFLLLIIVWSHLVPTMGAIWYPPV